MGAQVCLMGFVAMQLVVSFVACYGAGLWCACFTQRTFKPEHAVCSWVGQRLVYRSPESCSFISSYVACAEGQLIGRLAWAPGWRGTGLADSGMSWMATFCGYSDQVLFVH